MSEQVKRYSFGEFAEKHTHPVGPGSYVKASDYDALHAEAEALRAENARLQNALLEVTARRFAESWKKRTSDAALEQYLSAGIAQLEAERDALAAENARLRVKLMAIASAEPARHGIEWAKAHAAEGNNEVYAKWREAIDEAHAPAAENARLRAELEQSRDLIVEMSKHCNATALVADWLERNT